MHVREICSQGVCFKVIILFSEDQRKSVVGNGDILAVVRLCLLSLDAGVFDNDGQDKRNLPVETFLRPVVSTLLTINTHVYMSATKANHAINVLVTFLKVNFTTLS